MFALTTEETTGEQREASARSTKRGTQAVEDAHGRDGQSDPGRAPRKQRSSTSHADTAADVTELALYRCEFGLVTGAADVDVAMKALERSAKALKEAVRATTRALCTLTRLCVHNLTCHCCWSYRRSIWKKRRP